MNEELLEEFWIKKHENDYTILATERVYDLLREKTDNLSNENTKPVIKTWHYRTAFVNFLLANYHIDGLIRESRGSSHDDSWQKEVIIFNNGGVWSELLNSYRTKSSDTYECKPIVIDEEKITSDIIENWAKDYDCSGNGEEQEGRFIFCSYNDSPSRLCFRFNKCYFVATAFSKLYKRKINALNESDVYLKRIEEKELEKYFKN